MDMDMSSVPSGQYPPSNAPKRSLLVIDGSYLLISARENKLNLDYIKLVNELQMRTGGEFYEKWFVNSGDANASNNALNNMLRSAPPSGPQFRVKLLGTKNHKAFCKRCQCNVDSKVQKGVDVSIATLFLKHAFQNHCDQIVLLAGDGDFYEALSTVKDELRKDVVIVGFSRTDTSLDLQQLGKVIWLNEMFDKIQQTLPVQNAQPQPYQQTSIIQGAQLISPYPMVQMQQPYGMAFQYQTQQAQPMLQQQQLLQQLHQQQQLQLQPQIVQPQAQSQPLQQVQIRTQAPQVSSPQVPQVLAKPQATATTWQCTECTFLNQPASVACEICNSPKRIPAPVTAVPGVPAAGVPVVSPTQGRPNTVSPMPTQVSPTPPTASVARPTPVASVPTPAPSAAPANQSIFGFFNNPTASPTKSPTPVVTTTAVVTSVPTDKVYPCPLCTYHRASASSCEMCGYTA